MESNNEKEIEVAYFRLKKISYWSRIFVFFLFVIPFLFLIISNFLINVRALAIFVIIVSVIFLIFGIVTMTSIMWTNFHHHFINQQKNIWGILVLFPLGPIASLIFAMKAMKLLLEEYDIKIEIIEQTKED